MQGRRLPDDCYLSELEPGDYCAWRGEGDEIHAWVVCTPDGARFSLAMPHWPDKNGRHHEIEVHEDRTISVMARPNNTNSILSPNGWHGYLDHGVWCPC